MRLNECSRKYMKDARRTLGLRTLMPTKTMARKRRAAAASSAAPGAGGDIMTTASLIASVLISPEQATGDRDVDVIRVSEREFLSATAGIALQGGSAATRKKQLAEIEKWAVATKAAGITPQ